MNCEDNNVANMWNFLNFIGAPAFVIRICTTSEAISLGVSPEPQSIPRRKHEKRHVWWGDRPLKIIERELRFTDFQRLDKSVFLTKQEAERQLERAMSAKHWTDVIPKSYAGG